VTMGAINSQITSQSIQIAAPIGTSSEPARIGPALAAAVSSAGSLAAAVNARSYVGRIGTTLNGLGN
jgi:hypothetical protein